MPRLDLLPEDWQTPEDVVAAMKARRGGKLNEADRMVLHAPDFARGFNLLMGTVRNHLTVEPFLKELAICGVGYLNGSEFEVENHLPILIAEGATPAQVEALQDFVAAAGRRDIFDETCCAVMQLTIEMTNTVRVSDETFNRARNAMNSPRKLVELMGIISSYNMASRFLIALDI
ncbi:MAG: carboxymuconolactone decarboxylase family protein [Porticoccaceae bacterium]|jgi:alkylhydroperoxidase family enzyme|nr:carboxymuconolactone decarboxylase family protein [Porticoccaceae bacterium]